MAISVISISSDSSEESVGTSTTRVILFGMIPTTILYTTPTTDLPTIHDYIPLIPTDTPTTSPIVPTIPPIASTIHKVIENQVMAISVISISSDSSEESVGTSTTRVILFGMIPTTILYTTPTTDLPTIHDYIPLIPTDTPTSSPIVPTIPPIASTIQYTSPFVCTDSSDNDTPDTPPS
ncbi:hypothetical protein Tco_0464673 [Tanacetum coccineum]